MTPQRETAPGVRVGERSVDSQKFYELADLQIAKRIGGMACAIGLLIVVVLLPFDTPTHHVGASGWLLAGACGIVSVAGGLRLVRWPERISPNELLLLSYLALMVITVLQWLGGPRSPYAELFLLAAVCTAGAHPPRRVIPYLVALALTACAPLVYDGWDEGAALELVTHLMLWTGLSALAMYFVHVSQQRLHREGDELREVARADPLTRLGNRRAFDDALDRAIAGARRWDRPFSVVIADLTGFKAINDRFGHLEGDRCLREVGSALLTTVRAPDACFRWGGDEFALVLPTTDLAAAELVGRRLRTAVERRVILPSGDPLRVSCAAAQFEEGMDAEALLATADARLMAAKTYTRGGASPPQHRT